MHGLCLHTGATGSGDPHYVTFDSESYVYTFPDAGIFSILQVNFTNQSSTSQIVHVQGNFSHNPGFNPTWIKSVAFGIPEVFGYQVRTSQG